MVERSVNRASQCGTMEPKVGGERGDIPDVLDPGVSLAEEGHGVELLGDDRLARVGPEFGPGVVEQGGELQPLPFGRDDIAESDIDLQRESGRV